ncbi:FAD-binding oxidoreductase [Plantactinospora sp. WMMC1484]|uniref:FAD-binding oxidoreductase n=1 Tax=Plantactinospora sp. WMMC1484 TaxID=3404122 RepID=UPI003BF5DECC
MTPLAGVSTVVTFAVPDELSSAYAHRPGQYLTIRTMLNGRRLLRRYSICSPPGRLQFAAKRRPNGEFSAYVNDELRAGDVLDVMTPMGAFTLPPPDGPRCVVGVAVGSGITPVRAIALHVLATEPGSEVVLVCANRTRQHAMFADDLAECAQQYAGRLTILHVLSDDPDAPATAHGRLDPELLASLVGTHRLAGDAWLLSGPYDLVETLKDRLVKEGVSEDTVRTEAFHRP